MRLALTTQLAFYNKKSKKTLNKEFQQRPLLSRKRKKSLKCRKVQSLFSTGFGKKRKRLKLVKEGCN